MYDLSPWQDSSNPALITHHQPIKPKRRWSRSQAECIVKDKYHTLDRSGNTIESREMAEKESIYHSCIKEVLETRLESNLFQKRDRVSLQNIHILSKQRQSHRKTIKQQLSKMFVTKILPRLNSSNPSCDYVTQSTSKQLSEKKRSRWRQKLGGKMCMLPRLRVVRLKERKNEHNPRFSLNTIGHLKDKIL